MGMKIVCCSKMSPAAFCLTSTSYACSSGMAEAAEEQFLCRLELPRSLRIKVANANYRDIMDRCSFVGRPFAGCKPRFLNALIVMLKPIHVIPGDTIVFKEEVPRDLYFVYQGALRVVFSL